MNLGTGRILRGSLNNGYKNYKLGFDGDYNAILLHRLLGLHFIPNPKLKPIVDHKNNICDDNRIINLRWATKKENNQNKVLSKTNTSGIKGVLVTGYGISSDKISTDILKKLSF